MIVPIGYALGIVAMLLVRDLFLVLPGSGNPAIAAQGMLLMLLPLLLMLLMLPLLLPNASLFWKASKLYIFTTVTFGNVYYDKLHT